MMWDVSQELECVGETPQETTTGREMISTIPDVVEPPPRGVLFVVERSVN